MIFEDLMNAEFIDPKPNINDLMRDFLLLLHRTSSATKVVSRDYFKNMFAQICILTRGTNKTHFTWETCSPLDSTPPLVELLFNIYLATNSQPTTTG